MRRATEHGEIWLAYVDKRRPVVVVGRDDVQGARERTTVAPVTPTARGIASDVDLDQRDGLPLACVASCDELGTIPKSKLIRRIGRLSEAKLLELSEALRFLLQLD